MPRYSPDGRALAFHVVRHQALVQRSGPARRSLERAAAAGTRALARGIRSAGDARRMGARLAVAAVHGRGSRPRRSLAARRSAHAADAPSLVVARRCDRRLRAIARRLGARVRSRERRSIRRRCSPAARDGGGERAIEYAEPRAARAARDRRRARGHDQGLGRRARADVDRRIRRTSIRRRSGRCCIRSTAARTRRISTRWHFRWNTQVFAGHGYVVAAVNYHGSSGFGQKWLETIAGRYGEKEFADVEAGDRLAAAAGLHRSHAARRDRRQLRRLHGRVHERPHRPLPARSSVTRAATTGSA